MSKDDPGADPRLAAIYDIENRWAADDDFFLAIADRASAARVLDLGCGTGRLTVAIAGAGHVVTGIDPNRASLEAARAKRFGDRVTWIHGTSAGLAGSVFDVAVMTSHVAQIFVTDDEWSGVLVDLKHALVPGGTLAFDTRDPRARAWDRWNQRDSYEQVLLPDGQIVETWVDVTEIVDDVISFAWHNVFPDGSDIAGVSSLRFRSEQLVLSTLEAAEFQIENVYGGWRGEPIGADSDEIVIVARS